MTRARLQLLVLLVLMGLAFVLAPRPWPDALRLDLAGDTRVQAVLADGEAGPWRIRVERTDRIELAIEGPPLRELAILLPDGSRELVPVIRDGPLQRGSRTPPRDASLLFPFFVLVVWLWLTERIPLWTTGLAIPVVVVAGGVTTASVALQPFFHPIIALFFAGFALSLALEEVGLDDRLALGVLARVGDRPRLLYAGLLAMGAVASMAMSNTAAAATLVPLAITATSPLGAEAKGYQRALVLGVAYATTLGGIASPIGTPANPLAMEMLGRAGHPVGFVGWFAYGLPMVALFLPVLGAVVWWWFVDRLPTGFDRVQDDARTRLATLGAPSERSGRVLVVFALVLLGWLTESFHHLHPGLVGLAGVVGLVGSGVLGTEHLRRIPWEVLLTFGGGLALGDQLDGTGAAEWLATRLVIGGEPSAWVTLVSMGAASLGLTMVASNTASAAILIPLALPMASLLGVDPTVLVVVIAVASSIDFAMVIGTPPTMIAYSTERFTVAEIFRVGLVLDVVGLALVLGVLVPLWSAF